MSFNVLIINAPVFKVVEPYYDRPNFPRTALAFLAGHIRENSNDINVDVIDSKFERLDFQNTVSMAIAKNPKIVGITAMTNEVSAAAHLANLLKEQNPNIIVVIGGVHATTLAKRTLEEFPCFDFLIKGEGEVAFLNLINQIKTGAKIYTQGVCYIKNNQFYDGGTSPYLVDQNSLKPAWDLFNSAQEYMIQSSRGCPFSCNFCMNPGGRIVRARSVETTLDEIEWLIKNKNPKSIYFGDEIFTVNKKRAVEICKGMVARGIHKHISWWCQTHVNTIDEEIVKNMKAANCATVGLGVETGNEETLKKMGKGISKEKIKKAIYIMKKYKLSFNTFFIIGQPNETVKTALDTINFAVELNPTIPIFGVMVPYPGTKIWDMANKGEGGYKLLSSDWNSFNKQIGNALELEGVPKKYLEWLQIYGYLKVFIFNFRFIELFKFIFKYRSEGIHLLRKQYKNLFKRFRLLND